MRSIDRVAGRATDLAAIAERADIRAGTHLGKWKDHPVVRALGAASEAGDQPPLVAACGLVLAYGLAARDRRAASGGLRMLGSLILATGIKTALKHLISRTRPNVVLDEGRYEAGLLGPDEGPRKSFPSGHTAGAVAVARALGRAYPEACWAAYAGAAGIAVVQVPRGAHYPADVVAGALIGLAAEATVQGVMDRIAREAPTRPAHAAATRRLAL